MQKQKCCSYFLAKFDAVRKLEVVVTAVASDVQNKYLLTGDSEGVVCVWDMQGFTAEKLFSTGVFEVFSLNCCIKN